MGVQGGAEQAVELFLHGCVRADLHEKILEADVGQTVGQHVGGGEPRFHFFVVEVLNDVGVGLVTVADQLLDKKVVHVGACVAVFDDVQEKIKLDEVLFNGGGNVLADVGPPHGQPPDPLDAVDADAVDMGGDVGGGVDGDGKVGQGDPLEQRFAFAENDFIDGENRRQGMGDDGDQFAHGVLLFKLPHNVGGCVRPQVGNPSRQRLQVFDGNFSCLFFVGPTSLNGVQGHVPGSPARAFRAVRAFHVVHAVRGVRGARGVGGVLFHGGGSVFLTDHVFFCERKNPKIQRKHPEKSNGN